MGSANIIGGIVRCSCCGCYIIFLQLADTIVTVAITRAIEIVSRIRDDVGTITIEALDLAGLVDHCDKTEKEGDKDTYSAQLPWLRGKLFDTSEVFQGL